jgi:ribosome recycling factor
MITKEQILKESTEKMDKAVSVVDHDLGTLRTGRASTQLLDGITPEVYGSPTPIIQLANVSTPDGTTILVAPWDKNALKPIEKAILEANIGLTPNNDGKVIRLNIPPLTEQTRKDLVKRAHGIAEEARVAVRNVRRNVNDDIKRHEKTLGLTEDETKKLHEQVQKVTDEHIRKIDEHLAKKEKEIMTV